MGYDDDGFDNDEYDEFENTNGPKGLRDAQKAAARRNKDLEAQLAKLTSQLAERTLKDVLETKGLNPALGRFIIKDGIDAGDPASVDAWLGENGSLFGFKPAEDAPADDEGEADGYAELAAQQARMQGASQGALPDDRFQQANTEIQGAKSLGDIQAALNRAVKNTN